MMCNRSSRQGCGRCGRHKLSSSSGAILSTVGVGALLAIPLLDPLTRARFLNDVLIQWGFPLIIVAAVALGVLLAARSSAVLGGTLITLGILGLIVYGPVRAHQSNLYYASTVSESTQSVPAFSDRAPHQVAQRQATSSLSGINGTPGRTAYLAASDDYTTLIDKPGPVNPGYTAVVSQKIALTGQAKGVNCRFDDSAHDRMDGWFGNSLTREIAAEGTRLIARGADAWGWCDGEKPMVAVPLTRLEGFVFPHHVPAGVAVYDGSNGKVEILSGEETAELPGPVIGISYSERVNASLKVWNGTWWSALIKQSGLTDEVKDEDDTNALNASNFTLAQDGLNTYVSPFTSRAASVTVDAVAVMDASVVEAGEAPKMTLYKLAAPRASNAATADRIKADYSSLGWAVGLVIQEIVPAGDGVWAASIGLNQNVTHRVLVKDDGSSCLLDDRGTLISCTDDEEAGTGGTAAPGPAGGIPADIAALSDEQLRALQEAVTREVFERLNTGS